MKYLCYFFTNEVVGLQSLGCNFTENNVLDKKYIELTFHSKSDLYCVKGNVYI